MLAYPLERPYLGGAGMGRLLRLRATGALFLWRWLDRYFTLSDILDLLGWKTAVTAASGAVLTAVWALLLDWSGPAVVAVSLVVVAAIVAISAGVETKRGVRADRFIHEAEARELARVAAGDAGER